MNRLPQLDFNMIENQIKQNANDFWFQYNREKTKILKN